MAITTLTVFELIYTTLLPYANITQLETYKHCIFYYYNVIIIYILQEILYVQCMAQISSHLHFIKWEPVSVCKYNWKHD